MTSCSLKGYSIKFEISSQRNFLITSMFVSMHLTMVQIQFSCLFATHMQINAWPCVHRGTFFHIKINLTLVHFFFFKAKSPSLVTTSRYLSFWKNLPKKRNAYILAHMTDGLTLQYTTCKLLHATDTPV